MKKINMIIVFVIGMIALQSKGQDTMLLSKGNYAVITKTGTTYFNTYTKSELDSIDKVNCLRFGRDVDEFDGTITNTYNVTDNVSFIKIIKKGIPVYYLSIYIKETGIYTGKGAAIILCVEGDEIWVDKYKIVKPNEVIDYTLINNTFYTRGFIKLTVADLELLKKSEHMKYKLYISTNACSYDPERIKCLIKSK